MRDFWYEICAQRYASDKDLLNRIATQVENPVSKEDVAEAIERLLGISEVRDRALSEDADVNERRSDIEILDALEEFFDKIWYNRHQVLMHRVTEGRSIDPSILEVAKQAARQVEQKYGKDQLGPWSDFEWGILNGKLSALRWVMGDDWDFLDT